MAFKDKPFDTAVLEAKKKSSLKLWEISGRPPISWWLLVGVKSKIVAFSVERILPLDRMITTYMCTEKNHEKIVY